MIAAALGIILAFVTCIVIMNHQMNKIYTLEAENRQLKEGVCVKPKHLDVNYLISEELKFFGIN